MAVLTTQGAQQQVAAALNAISMNPPVSAMLHYPAAADTQAPSSQTMVLTKSSTLAITPANDPNDCLGQSLLTVLLAAVRRNADFRMDAAEVIVSMQKLPKGRRISTNQLRWYVHRRFCEDKEKDDGTLVLRFREFMHPENGQGFLMESHLNGAAIVAKWRKTSTRLCGNEDDITDDDLQRMNSCQLCTEALPLSHRSKTTSAERLSIDFEPIRKRREWKAERLAVHASTGEADVKEQVAHGIDPKLFNKLLADERKEKLLQSHDDAYQPLISLLENKIDVLKSAVFLSDTKQIVSLANLRSLGPLSVNTLEALVSDHPALFSIVRKDAKIQEFKISSMRSVKSTLTVYRERLLHIRKLYDNCIPFSVSV
jgi:hypothetical protein